MTVAEYAPPTEIDGTPVKESAQPRYFADGEVWATLTPAHNRHADYRAWEWSLTTGRLVRLPT